VLTADQQQAFDNIFNAKGLHLLSGTPSCGKTFLTRYLTHRWKKDGLRVMLTATTGCAAVRLSAGAKIVHRAFQFPHNSRPLPPIRPTDAAYEEILTADVILIDEMSMPTSVLLYLVMYRLGQLNGCPEAALSLKLILLVGDHAQLPAVCSGNHGFMRKAETSASKDEICFNCHISNSVW
jgi:ATP-dependent exoDNAse (exonuclease V) alpha subunit